MSGSLLEQTPHGQGNTLASRAGRAELAEGVALARTPWLPHLHQDPAASVERGIVLAAGALGSGKSEPGAFLLLKWAIRNPRRPDGRPTKWYALGPDFSLIKQEQLGKIMEHARRISEATGVEIVKRFVGGQDPRIILCHDQIILGRSTTDADRLRGHEIDGFWLDEAQNVTEKAFRIACSRLRSTTAVRIVLTGSPEDSPDWIWKLLSGEDEGYNNVRKKALEEGSGLYAFRWHSGQNASNTPGVLGVVRAIMEASAKGVAAQELEGRFPGTPEAPSLGVIDYGRAFVGRVSLTAKEALPLILGVDIGETEDFTWFSVLSARGVVLAMERFNAGTPGVNRATFYPELEQRIIACARKWRVALVVIDIAKAGKPISQNLQRKLGAPSPAQGWAFDSAIEVEGYPTDSPGKKSDVIEALAVALGRGDVRIPSAWSLGLGTAELAVAEVPQLRKEFEELVSTESGYGKRRWTHPDGGHDDGVVSLALAWHGLGMRPESPILQDLSRLRAPASAQSPSSPTAGLGESPFGRHDGGGYRF